MLDTSLTLLDRLSRRPEDAEIGLTVNAVLIAKSRVLQWMRWETDGLID